MGLLRRGGWGAVGGLGGGGVPSIPGNTESLFRCLRVSGGLTCREGGERLSALVSGASLGLFVIFAAIFC